MLKAQIAILIQYNIILHTFGNVNTYLSTEKYISGASFIIANYIQAEQVWVLLMYI